MKQVSTVLSHSINRKQAAAALAAACCATSLPIALADSHIEEMIVTGQAIGGLRLNTENDAGSRLGLSIFDTPASVDLISRDELTIKGDHEALHAITRTAGLSASASPGNGNTAVSSRGFAGHATTLNTYDGTRLYITAGTVTFPADTWTLERVEILRGAGSVINGMGALGTTINYVPKAPSFAEPSFETLAAAGSFGMRRVAAGGGTQLSEHWALRLDATHHRRDGYVDRAGEQRDVVAGSLLFQPNADFSVKFSMDYADVRAAPYWGTPLIDGRASGSHRRNNYNFRDGFVAHEDLWTRVRTNWRLSPAITFRNDTYHISAEREWQNLEEFSYNSQTNQIDRASYLGIIHDQEQLGTRSDLLIESELGGRANRFTIGAEINVVDLDYYNNFSTGGFAVAGSVPIFGFDPGYLPRAAVPTILDYSTDSTQYAFFFDNVLELTDELSLVAGGRYDDFDFDRFNHPQANRSASSFDAGFSAFTWRAGVVYQPHENVSFYAQSSTAADPVTSPISINAANADFDLSKGRQYETGIKHQIFGGAAEYTLAYFDIEKKDMVTRLPGTTVSQQIGQQSSDGFEFTFRAMPLENLSLDFNAARIDARFDEFYAGNLDLRGNTPRDIPETTANLWLNWSPMPRVQLGGGLRYVDSRYADDANTQRLPFYTVFDASANWTLNSNMALTLRARNLSNERNYILSQYIADQWIFGDPRSFELSFRYSR